jgi:glycosyltransferase involved in cell wall biosynthesis
LVSSQKRISVAVISGPVGKTPNDITYSFVFDEAYRLAKKGIDVHIVRSKIEKDSFSYDMRFHGIERRIDNGAIRMIPRTLSLCPLISLLRKPTSIYWENLYAESVSRVVEKNNVDLIHAHFAYPEGLVGLLAKRKTKKPLIITVHGYDILIEPSVGYGVRLSRKIDAVIRMVLNQADAIIAASKETFNETCRIVNDADKVQLIPNGVDVERFNPDLDGSHIRKELGIEGGTVVFSLKGHEPQYGLEYLIRAASIVTEKKNDVLFVIGGDGSLRHYHEQLATKLGVKEKIMFIGRIPPTEVPYYDAMSDIVVVPSLQEAFGLVISEAMACGKPVIGTKVGGIPDQIIDSYNGFLVQPRDPKEIAEKILRLIENPEEAKRMGMNGRKIAEKKFDISKRIDRIVSLYVNLVAPS